jgi:sugar lactone lactonase YvrE
MKLVAGSKICLAILGLILLCPNVGQAVVAPIFYNHPTVYERIDGGHVTIRQGSIERLNPNGTRDTIISGLDRPYGIALDDKGNLYYGDFKLNVLAFELLKRSPEGTITNLGQVLDIPAGTFSISSWGGDLATNSSGDVFFNHPTVYERIDGKYVMVRQGSLEKLSPNGTWSTVVSGLDRPTGIALDVAGNVYFGDFKFDILNFELFKLSTDGKISSLGQVLNIPSGPISIGSWGGDLTVGPSGDIFYNHPTVYERLDSGYVTVRTGSIERLDPDGTHTTVVTGLDQPLGIALDAAGNLYYGDYGGLRFEIFEWSPDGTITNLGEVLDIPQGPISINMWGGDLAVPEPSTLFLLGLGSMALVRKRRA